MIRTIWRVFWEYSFSRLRWHWPLLWWSPLLSISWSQRSHTQTGINNTSNSKQRKRDSFIKRNVFKMEILQLRRISCSSCTLLRWSISRLLAFVQYQLFHSLENIFRQNNYSQQQWTGVDECFCNISPVSGAGVTIIMHNGQSPWKTNILQISMSTLFSIPNFQQLLYSP